MTSCSSKSLTSINQRPGKIVQTDHISDETTDKTTLEEFAAKEKLEALRASTKLSAREDQVLELILKDYLDREIACELGIDEGSVKTIKFRMRQKFKEVAGQWFCPSFPKNFVWSVNLLAPPDA